MTSTSSAHLTCLCGAISVPGTLLRDPSLPFGLSVCHCNPCRRTTGSLGVSFPHLKSSPAEDTLSKLTPYYSSEIVTRYFCTTCGCHCFLFHRQWNQWYCIGGIVEPSLSSQSNSLWLKDITKVTLHEYVLDTIDGGLTPLMLNLGGRKIPTWSAAPQESSNIPHDAILSLPRDSLKHLPPPSEHSYLSAKCHCGGVSLSIKRANYTSGVNTGLQTRYIPSDPTKWLSYFCACRSCRLSLGVSLTPWMLVLPSHVFNANAPTAIENPSSTTEDTLVPVTFGHHATDPGANPSLTIKHHWSSTDTLRSFCGRCGATISYWCEKRPDELDLAVGILRAEEGSMARRWLEWKWGQCSSTEESIDREICDAWVGGAAVMTRLED